MADCPKGGDHNWRNAGETATHVTHECRKCKQTITRPKQAGVTGARDAVINATALFFVLALLGLLAAMFIAAGQVQGA